MSDVQFESENTGFKSRRIFGEPTTPRMINLVMRTFRIKSEKTAGNFLMVLAVILLIFAIYLSIKAIHENNNPTIENNLSEETIESLPLETRMQLEK